MDQQDVAFVRELDCSGLPEKARKSAQEFFGKLLEDGHEHVLSITVVGSAASGDWRRRISDVNSVVVLDEVDLSILEPLALLGRRYGKKGLQAPTLMTPRYIERSLDVFPLEFLEFKAAHTVVYGRDFFKGLTFDKADVRLACERESKSLLLKARRGYLVSLNDAGRLKAVLLDLCNAAVPVLRGMLFLADREAPAGRRAVIEAAGDALDVPPAAFQSTIELRGADAAPALWEMQDIFSELYKAIEGLSDAADNA